MSSCQSHPLNSADGPVSWTRARPDPARGPSLGFVDGAVAPADCSLVDRTTPSARPGCPDLSDRPRLRGPACEGARTRAWAAQTAEHPRRRDGELRRVGTARYQLRTEDRGPRTEASVRSRSSERPRRRWLSTSVQSDAARTANAKHTTAMRDITTTTPSTKFITSITTSLLSAGSFSGTRIPRSILLKLHGGEPWNHATCYPRNLALSSPKAQTGSRGRQSEPAPTPTSLRGDRG